MDDDNTATYQWEHLPHTNAHVFRQSPNILLGHLARIITQNADSGRANHLYIHNSPRNGSLITEDTTTFMAVDMPLEEAKSLIERILIVRGLL